MVCEKKDTKTFLETPRFQFFDAMVVLLCVTNKKDFFIYLYFFDDDNFLYFADA